MASKSKQDPKLSFEKALTALDEVVASLEQGNLSLDESLSSFQTGVGLLRRCIERLNNFDEQVELLLTEYHSEAPGWLGNQETGGRQK